MTVTLRYNSCCSTIKSKREKQVGEWDVNNEFIVKAKHSAGWILTEILPRHTCSCLHAPSHQHSPTWAGLESAPQTHRGHRPLKGTSFFFFLYIRIYLSQPDILRSQMLPEQTSWHQTTPVKCFNSLQAASWVKAQWTVQRTCDPVCGRRRSLGHQKLSEHLH